MARPFHARLSTVHLIGDIRRVPGVARVFLIPPQRSHPVRPTMIRITLDGADGDGRPIYSDFTLTDARAWLAAERVKPIA